MTALADWKIHPAAELFPILSDDELRELAEDIAANGLEHDIVRDAESGDVIDGRNRLLACQMAGVEPRFDDRYFDDQEAIWRYVASSNIHRRHLSTSQRAMLADEIRKGLSKFGQSQDALGEAATVAGVSRGTAGMAQVVNRDGLPELGDAVRRGDVSVSAAAAVSRLPDDVQGELAAQGPAAITKAAAGVRKKDLGALMSSAKDDWCTPEEVLERVFHLDVVALDPCSNADSLVDAAVAWAAEDDGLAQDWTEAAKGGLVYMNPPYGRSIKAWVEKVAEEAAKGCEIVSLVPARVDTAWWRTLTDGAAAWCAWHGRITFVGAAAGAPFPVAVVYHGQRLEAFAEAFESVGTLWGRLP